MKFECHIALKPDHEDRAKQVGKQYGFKTSKIADEDGDGTFCYLKKSGVDFEKVQRDMYACAATLKLNKVPFLRMKIKLVLFDQREF